MFNYFKNWKTTYFDVFCLKFSIETKIKTIFQISNFNLSTKLKMAFWGSDLADLILIPYQFLDIE